MTSRILIVEDSVSLARSYKVFLEEEGHELEWAASVGEARAFSWNDFDAILLDLKLPDADGIDLIPEIQSMTRAPVIIVITSDGSISTAVNAVRKGAYDFLVKPFSQARLVTTLDKALDCRQLRQKVELLEDTFDRENFYGFIGRSLAMQAVYRIIEQAAKSDADVFVTGESGTGKELAAQALHKSSKRAAEPFVALNCAAIPKDLVESELFGHKKGAFTGATQTRDGAITRAEGGTLFLDEICEMDIGLQAKLLRVIQSRTFHVVGGDNAKLANIRIVAATNREPLEAVRLGLLREDLYFRLNVIPVRLPALCERDEDVIEIANHFLKIFNDSEEKTFESISEGAVKSLCQHAWPGNVRELQNRMRQAIVLNDGPLLTSSMLDLVKCDIGEDLAGTTDIDMLDTSENSSWPEQLPEKLWQIEKKPSRR